MKNRTDISFLHGESYTHYTLPYEKIGSDAPRTPGLYSWHLRIRPGFEDVTAKFLGRVFQQSTLHADVSGNLRLHYQGSLHKTSPDFSVSDVNKPLMQALMMIPVPLYIGISQNLRSRLRRHKESLYRTLNDDARSDFNVHDGSVVNPDTDEESVDFGARLGKFWRQSNFIEPHALFVKLTVPDWCPTPGPCRCDQSCRDATRAALLEAESSLNTLFNPVFGRK